MTKKERIEELEREVAELQLEVARLRSNGVPIFYAPVALNACPLCGTRYNGGYHICHTAYPTWTSGTTWDGSNITAIYKAGVA